MHLAASVLWAVAVVPTLLWWRDSVLWVLMVSLWANVVSHASAYEAARAKEIAAATPECAGNQHTYVPPAGTVRPDDQ